MAEIILFWSKESIFSNFHYAVFYDEKGCKYTSSEQFYMKNKALFHNCLREAVQIQNTQDPFAIKRIGRSLPKSNAWYTIQAIPVMRKALHLKFTQNACMRQELMDTGYSIMAEASPYDDFWGIKLRSSDPRAKNPQQWLGINWLGRVLQSVRAELREKH
jgi:ribA/ribD-fused uncharacterized protein